MVQLVIEDCFSARYLLQLPLLKFIHCYLGIFLKHAQMLQFIMYSGIHMLCRLKQTLRLAIVAPLLR